MKRMVVVGGSRGIGAAVVRLGVMRGDAVAFTYLGSEDAARALVEATGGKAIALKADAADEASTTAAIAEAAARLGGLDVLVHSAGITGKAGKFTDTGIAEMRRVIDLNVMGALIAAKAAVPLMSTARGHAGGAIVFISSMAAALGAPNDFVWYAASKGAIDSLTIGLGRELGPEGIRVMAVAPGLIETDIHALAGLGGRIGRLSETIPLRRGGTTEETAEAVLFLASDAASYITGSTLRVSGGR